ncbi:MAG: type II/IV secretion system ATPase subunit [Candidatus Aenigmarchaeota archaeon]|nr:type II/IV secretion system ATPase subunit [Candidatus Aenigmarchaeota archaeon]
MAVSLKNFVRRVVVGYKNYLASQPKPYPTPPMAGIAIQPMVGEVPPVTIPIKIEKKEEKEARPKPEIEGVEIPRFPSKRIRIAEAPAPEEERRKISMVYPLIPRKPGRDEPIFAYAKIYWDAKQNKYVYQVVEPELTEGIKSLLGKMKELLEERLDIDFSKLKRFEAKDYLHKIINELLIYHRFKVTEKEKMLLSYFIERDFIGLGKIEPLMNDEQIEDINCDGVNTPLFVFHRNPKLGSVVTNIIFENPDELDSYIHRIAQLCGKSVSVASPLVDGTLPDGSRVQATLATDIARRGSNFTIRKFTEEPLTPIHLLNYGTLDVQTLAFLWLAVDFGKSVLVSGGTASGKTTLLNVLSLFIRPERKIVSIEDTPELKLPHSHWIPHVARTPIAMEEGKKIGEVDLFDLLKESMRQRPDYIIVGEVRGKEAYVLFQEMATGHASLATIHAENLPKLTDRLTTPPISLPPSLIGSLDLIVFLLRVRYKDKHVRKVNEILEVVGVDPETRMPITNEVFKWNAMNDEFEIVGKSTMLKKISQATGLTEQQVRDELEKRMLVLSWMKERNIVNYKDVFNVINMYYSFPEKVISTIMGGA